MNLFSLPDDNADDEYEELEPDPVSESQARASRDGKEFDLEAFDYLAQAGARVVDRYVVLYDGFRLDALVEGVNGARFYVDAHGTPDRTDRSKAGMRRQDTMLKFGFKALRLRQRGCPHPLILVTSHMPAPARSAAFYLRELGDADALWDAVATHGDFSGLLRLRRYFTDTPPLTTPLPAPWRAVPEQLRLDQLDPFGQGDADA